MKSNFLKTRQIIYRLDGETEGVCRSCYVRQTAAMRAWFLQVFWYPRKGKGFSTNAALKRSAPASALKWIF